MKVEIGTITIKSYQMEDFVNMLTDNNYIVEVQRTKDNNHYYITICKIFEDFEESEENNE